MTANTKQSVTKDTTASPRTASAKGSDTSNVNITTRNGFTVTSYEEAIIMTESGGNVTADNGSCYGLFQLSYGKLNGDTSVANQYSVATAYMQSRYGSWEAAYQHEINYNWW